MNRNSNCETCQPLISAMLDGELTTAENDELDLHLQQCADCQIQVERFRAVNGAVRQLSNPTIVKTELSKQVMSRSFSIWRTIPLAAAATLLVCLAIGTWPNPQPAKAEHVSAEQFVKPMEDLAYLNLQEQSDQEPAQWSAFPKPLDAPQRPCRCRDEHCLQRREPGWNALLSRNIEDPSDADVVEHIEIVEHQVAQQQRSFDPQDSEEHPSGEAWPVDID